MDTNALSGLPFLSGLISRAKTADVPDLCANIPSRDAKRATELLLRRELVNGVERDSAPIHSSSCFDAPPQSTPRVPLSNENGKERATSKDRALGHPSSLLSHGIAQKTDEGRTLQAERMGNANYPTLKQDESESNRNAERAIVNQGHQDGFSCPRPQAGSHGGTRSRLREIEDKLSSANAKWIHLDGQTLLQLQRECRQLLAEKERLIGLGNGSVSQLGPGTVPGGGGGNLGNCRATSWPEYPRQDSVDFSTRVHGPEEATRSGFCAPQLANGGVAPGPQHAYMSDGMIGNAPFQTRNGFGSDQNRGFGGPQDERPPIPTAAGPVEPSFAAAAAPWNGNAQPYQPDLDALRRVKGQCTDATNDAFWRRTDFPWSKAMVEQNRSKFGNLSFRYCQEQIINATMSKCDVFVLMPTGGGKSLCYQLPAVLSPGLTVVVSPLRSLIQDQVFHLHNLGITAAALAGSSTDDVATDWRQTRQDALSGALKVLFLTPEKLDASESARRLLGDIHQSGKLARVVIDEAHCVSQWGHGTWCCV